MILVLRAGVLRKDQRSAHQDERGEGGEQRPRGRRAAAEDSGGREPRASRGQYSARRLIAMKVNMSDSPLSDKRDRCTGTWRCRQGR